MRDATDGENRARVTSGVITGIFIAGDDFSKGGSKEVKEKAMKYLTNAEINAIANGESFHPVDGNGESQKISLYAWIRMVRLIMLCSTIWIKS